MSLHDGKVKCVYPMLFLLDREYIQLYSLSMVHVLTQGRFLIDEQPRKERTLVRKHVWSWWDAPSDTLFYIRNKSSKASSENLDFVMGT